MMKSRKIIRGDTKETKPVYKTLSKIVTDARAKEEWEFLEQKAEKSYIEARNKERGPVEKQLEFLVENGLDAFVVRDQEIRARNPKPESKKS